MLVLFYPFITNKSPNKTKTSTTGLSFKVWSFGHKLMQCIPLCQKTIVIPKITVCKYHLMHTCKAGEQENNTNCKSSETTLFVWTNVHICHFSHQKNVIKHMTTENFNTH